MLTRRANWAMLRPVSEGDRRKRCGVEYAPGQPPVVAVFIDDAVLRETVGAILEDAGYRVWRLPADPDGVAAVRATPPDAVLLEVWVGAPERGLALLARLRADAATDAVPVVGLSTAAATPERRTVLRDLGCAAVLPAPFDLDDLLATLAAVLAPDADELSEASGG